MTTTQQTMLGIYAAIVAAWPIRHLVLSWIERRTDHLSARSPRYAAADPPLVSAIIPAKDEEQTLEDCLATVSAQSYPNLEILVVDDRSTDATAAIARRWAAADPRVRLISIEELPPGWTGKTHALHVAAAEAQGEWFWFLDADTRHAPDCLSIVLEYARVHRAVLASLIPEMRCGTFWEAVVQPLEGIVLMRSFPLFLVNNDASRRAFANGQFILIGRPAYEAAGGHFAVRDRFVEDIYLARRVKALGLPIRVALAPEISSTRMYTSLRPLVRGWSRILYDALGRSPWPLLGKVLEPLLFSQTFAIALAAGLILRARGDRGPFPLWLVGLSVAHLALQLSVLYRMYRMTSPATARYAVWYPLAGLVSGWISFRAIVLCLTGRVTWRGTSYGPSAPAKPPATESIPQPR
jgi:glycosyltransferase involved in cell wall biosynthesis